MMQNVAKISYANFRVTSRCWQKRRLFKLTEYSVYAKTCKLF
jgi:hypothetical protein